jgi:hypothetical protein
VLPGSVVWTPEFLVAEDLATIREHIDHLLALDSRFGGTDLVRVAVRLFETVSRKLGAGSYSPAITRDLQALAGELAEVAGWFAFDAGHHGLTRRMNQESLYFTRLCGDKRMELLTLQNAAMHAGALGRPHEALQLANSVLDGCYDLSQRVRALFLIRRARALAQGGGEGALSMFDEVRSLYT